MLRVLVNQAKRTALRKAEEAKADAALRKERIVVVKQDKVLQREAEVRNSGRDDNFSLSRRFQLGDSYHESSCRHRCLDVDETPFEGETACCSMEMDRD